MNKIIGIGLIVLTGFTIYLDQRISSLEKEKNTFVSKNIFKASSNEKKSKSISKKSNISSEIIKPIITNKRFQSSDPTIGIYESSLWWDVKYKAVKLKKPTRAIKGVLKFSDLFGEVKFLINVTINDELSPNKEIYQQGVGFNYNQFMESHKWIRSESLENMKITLDVKSIIYKDGTMESF